jgi:hypothetical protein
MLYLRRCFSFALVILMVAAAPSRSDAAPCSIAKLAELPVTMAGLRPMVPVSFNGAQAQLIVDSGAFYSMLSPSRAAELKLKVGSAKVNFRVVEASGEFVPALAGVAQFSIANVPMTNIQFLVGGGDPGAGAAGLLGQNILGMADVEYDLAKGVIRIMRPTADCGEATLAYWATSVPYSLIKIDPGSKPRPIHTVGAALLNGKPIRVVFDTGAPTSTLTLAAARRVGISPNSPDVVPMGSSSWIGPFASLKIDTEEMKNVRLRFSDFSMDEGDLLLGADFFLSHRVYVANSQDKLYFTYNGGPPFDLTSMPSSPVAPGLVTAKFQQSAYLPFFNPGCGCQ